MEIKDIDNKITFHQEARFGYYYPQPVERLNGKTYYDYDVDSIERKKWGAFYFDSKKYSAIFDYMTFNSTLWTNEKRKIRAFNFIFDYVMNNSINSVTKLFPFEIQLLNKGYKFIQFSEVNALQPSYRIYQRGNKKIGIGFGLNKVNHFFECKHGFFQVDNNIENYTKAINGKLKPII